MAPVRHRWSINDVIGGIRNTVMPSDCSPRRCNINNSGRATKMKKDRDGTTKDNLYADLQGGIWVLVGDELLLLFRILSVRKIHGGRGPRNEIHRKKRDWLADNASSENRILEIGTLGNEEYRVPACYRTADLSLRNAYTDCRLNCRSSLQFVTLSEILMFMNFHCDVVVASSKMPKFSVPLCSKLQNYVNTFGSDVFCTDGKVLTCKICEQSVNYEKKYFISQHISTTKHKNALSKVTGKKISLLPTVIATSSRKSQFASDLSKAFLAADIPLWKVQDCGSSARFL
ncbi:hypothetical protein ANN_09291 [Periplaneta americana]|uniref:Uncharacterized protein n=1 Tax=Periplaneta americana TaxID=6978 RepID=A0ABQ8TNG3_PERAM|nr:hypothetical protein ANN_09291 [Periplaneta americana]